MKNIKILVPVFEVKIFRVLFPAWFVILLTVTCSNGELLTANFVLPAGSHNGTRNISMKDFINSTDCDCSNTGSFIYISWIEFIVQL